MSEGKRCSLAFFLLLSFLLAFPIHLEETFQWLRLKKLDLNLFPSERMEVEALDLLKHDILRFWPLTWTARERFCSEMERREPVKMKVEITPGRLQITPVPLNVVTNFYWDGLMWYLSDTGKVWSEKHPVNRELYASFGRGPKITIDSSMSLPVKGDQDVKFFSYPVVSFLSYIKSIVNAPWPGTVSSLRFLKRGGIEQIAVRIKWKGKSFTVLLDNGEYLKNKIIAVSELLQKGIMLKANTIFDTTYDDKIIVRGVKSNVKGAMGL